MNEPRFIHCHRAHLVQYDSTEYPLPYMKWDITAFGIVWLMPDIYPTRVDDLLYAPGLSKAEAFKEKVFMDIARLLTMFGLGQCLFSMVFLARR